MVAEVKPIRTEADHDAAIEDVTPLGRGRRHAEGDRLTVLAAAGLTRRASSERARASWRCSA